MDAVKVPIFPHKSPLWGRQSPHFSPFPPLGGWESGDGKWGMGNGEVAP
jgi:hypothetical protein